jgi:hypothetical protein
MSPIMAESPVVGHPPLFVNFRRAVAVGVLGAITHRGNDYAKESGEVEDEDDAFDKGQASSQDSVEDGGEQNDGNREQGGYNR